MNDWIVANITNPTFDVSDFLSIADMSLNNTLMLKKEDYLKSNFIKDNPLFTKEDGTFSEEKFDEFYKKSLLSFLEFTQNSIPQSMELSMFDTDRTKDSKIKNNNFSLNRIVNPDRQKIGIEGINVWSDREKSTSEIAQTQKIWDSESNTYKDYSPNDRALFNGKKDFGMGFLSSLFSDPLVMAQWDEEGFHIDPITKKQVKHKKGQLKLNDEGTYYYETLNGRSPIGRLVLSALDTITVDGTGINKYDFFDSDDIEKSVSGVITKNVVSLLPMFLGGTVGTVYSTAIIAKELSKALPMLYGICTMFSEDLQSPLWLNTIAALGLKFTSNTSDYAKEHVFSIENFGNLISDVALQWGLQKTIAETVNKLRKSNLYIDDAIENAHNLYKNKENIFKAQAAANPELWQNSALGQACLKKFLPAALKATVESTKLGRDISLAYMSIISNSDVYGDMIQHGANKVEAAAVALGSTIGMFAVDKGANLGTVFFDDATDESVKAARYAIKHELKDLVSNFNYKNQLTDITPTNKVLSLINLAAKRSKQWFELYSEDLAYHTTNMYEKMMTEGLEEVSEELVSDTAKSIYELAGLLGFDTSTNDVGAWDNMLERYSMSMIGGALGGGIFYGKEVWDGKSFKRDKSNENIATLIRNGHVNDLRDELEKRKNKGKLGNTKLSALNYEINNEGKIIWLTAKDKKESQNDIIANIINDKITSLEAIINNNQMNLSDDKLFEQLVLSETRFARYQNISNFTNYYLDFNNVMSNVISAELDLNKASKTVDGTVNGSLIPSDSALSALTPELLQKRFENIANLQLKLDKAREKKNLFLSGDTSLDYARKLNFIMDPYLHNEFLPIDEELLWNLNFKNKKPEEITDADRINFITKILPEAKQALLKERATIAWERYKSIEKVLAPIISNISQTSKEYKSWVDKFNKINLEKLNGESLRQSFITPDSKFENETDEDYNNRNVKLINPETGEEETNEEFNNRYFNRLIYVNQYNDNLSKLWVDELLQELQKVNGVVDPITLKTIKASLPTRIKDIINNKINMSNLNMDLKVALKNLNNDLSNVKEIEDGIIDSILNSTKINISNKLDSIANIQDIDSEYTLKDYFSDFNLNEDTEWTIRDIIEDPTVITDIFDEDTINNKVVPVLLEVAKIVGEDIRIGELMQNIKDVNLKQILDADNDKQILGDIKPVLSSYLNSFTNFIHNEIQNVVNSIKNNPLYNIEDKIKASIKNPILDLLYALQGKTLDNIKIDDIENVLNIVENKFQNIDDIDSLIIDSTQLSIIENTKDALKLVNTFLYAASSDSNMNNPIGHNKIFNLFADNHKNVISSWEILPELDADYAAIYKMEIKNYTTYIDLWLELSNKNKINKKAKFEKTDKKFSESLFTLIQNKLNNKSFKVDVDDSSYNLLKGIEKLSIIDNDHAYNLYNLERLIYTNFLEALQTSNLSVLEFLNKSKLLENLLYDGLDEITRENDLNKIFQQISKQLISQIDDTISVNNLTSYDKLLYFASILTLNPQDFYSKLKTKVEKDLKIAPITTLEYASKISLAANNLQFRDIIRYAYTKSGDKKYFASNTVVVPGVAGAGKTQVIGKADKNYYNPEEIIALGPTKTQSTSLQETLNLTTSYTIDEFLKNILGEDVFQEIFNTNIDNYFDHYESEDGFMDFVLKPDAKIIFKLLDKVPKLLLIDEATHLSSIKALILDTYMRESNGVLKLLGDPNQRGFINYKNGMGNIREVDLFAVRTPKLTISLRDNNILKQSNLEVVRTLLDQVYDNVINYTEEKLVKYWPTVKNLMSKFKFKVYNKEDLNGDLITSLITDDIINKINKPNMSIGFIGNIKTSATYKKLVDAGLESKLTSLSIDLMQGQEFDYVVIDHGFKLSGTSMEYRDFLLDLYTLMSRGKTASIFIDNNLSNIIGNNVEDNYKALAPNLNDKINGVSAIDTLRKLKLDLLLRLDLSEITINGKPIKNSTAVDTNEVVENDFIDPEKIPLSLETDAIIDNLLTLEETDLEESIKEYVNSEFTVPSFGEVIYLNTEVTPKVKRTNETTGETYEYDLWKIQKPKDGPLRNLQALLNDGSEAYTFKDKKKWSDLMYKVKSALIFNHSYSETHLGTVLKVLPTEIFNNFKEEDWKNGRYEIEIREATPLVKPLYAPLKEEGFLHSDGKRYIANIVFKVKNRKGLECIFDLTGINNPKTLNDNLDTIKSNIDKKLNKSDINETLKNKLLNIKNTIDDLAKIYTNLVDLWIKDFNKNGSFSLDVTNSINFTKCTWIKKRTGTPIRLGGNIDPNTGEVNYESLETFNPGMNFSDVYTYADNDNELNSIDKNIKGKAVVFVSSDTLIPKDKLWEVYKNLKKDPVNNTPTVRMLVLKNYGLNLSQMYDPKFIKAFQAGDEKRKPLRLNFIGILMFTSMWNFRAGLLQFNKALLDWKTSNNYTDDKVKTIITALNEIYHKRIKNVEKYLNAQGITLQDLDNLESFNQKDLKDIPMFRLGVSDNNNGFYLRSFNVKDSEAYSGKDIVDLLVISPDKAIVFQKLLNDVLKYIVPNVGDDFRDTLNVQILKEDGTNWGIDEFIDLENAKHRRTLSNLLKFTKETGLTINFDGKEIAYPKGQEWSVIPNLINSIIKTVTYCQYNPLDALSGSGLEFAKIYLHDKDDDTKTTNFKVQVGLWLTGKDAILKVKDSNTTGHPDRTLLDMFELIFHGTTEDVHRPYSKENPFHKLEDARFKEGFFINPDINIKLIDFDQASLGNKTKNIFYPIETNKALFTSDNDIRASGLSLSVKDLYNIYNKVKTSNTELKEKGLPKVESTPKTTSNDAELSTDKKPVVKKGITFDKFNDTIIDLDNNYYLIYKTDSATAENVLNNGLQLQQTLSDATIIANLDTIYDALIQQSLDINNDGLIIIEIPKEEISSNRVRLPNDLIEITKNNPNLIPTNYIKLGFINLSSNDNLRKNSKVYELIKNFRLLGEDISYQEIDKAIEMHKNSSVPALVNNFLNTNDEDILKKPLIVDKDQNNDLITLSLELYLNNMLNNFGDSINNIYIEDNQLFIKGENNLYTLDMNNYTLKIVNTDFDTSTDTDINTDTNVNDDTDIDTNTDTNNTDVDTDTNTDVKLNFLETNVSIFGKTLPLKNAVIALLDNDNIRLEMIDLNDIEEESIDSFKEELNTIISNADLFISEEAIKEALAEFRATFIMNPDYLYISSYLSDNFENIYKQLFLEC